MASPYTTITEYSRANQESTVTLVGNYHHAGPGYMNGLRSTLCGFEKSGAKVHYENIEVLDAAGIEALPDEFRVKYLALSGLMTLSQRYSEKSGGMGILDTVRDHLELWERHDASMVQMAEQLSADDVERLEKFEKKFMTKRVPTRLGHIATDKMVRSFAGLIVGYRDQIALEAVDVAITEEPSQELVLLWGEGHIPGLRRGLEERGYQHEYTVLQDVRL